MTPRVSIDLLEYENGILRMDGSVDRVAAEGPAGLKVRVNGRIVELREEAAAQEGVPGEEAAGAGNTDAVSGMEAGSPGNAGAISGMDAADPGRRSLAAGDIQARYTGRFADVTLREETLTDRRAFVLELPLGKLCQKNTVEFLIGAAHTVSQAAQGGETGCAAKKGMADDGGESQGEELLPVLTGGYQAKICDTLKNSYWCFENYMVTLRRNGSSVTGVSIRRAGRTARVRREAALLKEILCASYGSKKMFGLRALYWLAGPFYRKKNIWITFDKLYKGGDCGEYFYKYMAGRKDAGITPVYVIRQDAPDYRRLTREGLSPAAYRSTKQRLQYLYASMVFGTHSGVHSFCGLNNWEIQFLQDRLRAVNTCIQHGLSVQELSADSNRCVNNNKRYYCASKNEIENLSGPKYDYDPRVLRLTGIPRYDGLTDREQRQILITPTWRNYIAMPSVMGRARPYNPDFKNTDYYKTFQNLLGNKKLAQKAKETGYRIVYLLHPVISAQRDDFQPGEGIEILSALESDYEKLLTEASLMVTDYSGVQFDFAYMRKPILYYHPPQLPPHYGDGGFAYESQGFGEICREEQELVALLCDYMDSGCRLKELYRQREDSFFAFNDKESCRRIFEDALAYQQGRQ